MKIACLQFSPSLGKLKENIERANAILSQADTRGLDLLVLPELAFTGYNFPSLAAILPFLEPTAAGASTQWAKQTARRLKCIVAVGYPETSLPPPEQTQPSTSTPTAAPLSPTPASTLAPLDDLGQPRNAGIIPVPLDAQPRDEVKHNFNSVVVVSPTGGVLAHYRKTFLYYTDATWASPGPGFSHGTFALSIKSKHTSPSLFFPSNLPTTSSKSTPNAEQQPPPPQETTIKATLGICMDINPHAFTAPWSAYEFANYVADCGAQVAVLSMAWLSQSLSPEDVLREPGMATPDLQTLSYWVERFAPVVGGGVGEGRDEGDDEEGEDGEAGEADVGMDMGKGKGIQETILVMANRAGVEGETCYAGTSTVMKVGGGMVRLWGVLGKGEEGVLVVDTEQEPPFVLHVAGGDKG